MQSDPPPESFQMRLPAHLRSAIAARRLLGAAVDEWGGSETTRADAALAVSELVTNSVLHAGTAVEVCVTRCGPGVRIEVRDGGRCLPATTSVRPEELVENRTMTGRGLALVATVADRWGAEPRSEGKVVWAEVGCERGGIADPVPGRRRRSPTRRRPSGRAAVVAMLGVPVSTVYASSCQLADLQRELTFVALATPSDTPKDLAEVVETGRGWLDELGGWADAERRVVDDAGETPRTDFEVVVPADIAERMDEIGAWLERAVPAVAARLLTPPAGPEVSEYRRWCREEVVRQLSGQPPRRCPI